MAYYYAGRSGDSYLDATIHYTADCDALLGPARPIAETSVDGQDLLMCGDCTPLDDEPESGSGASDTCQTVKNDGEVCGRELPCSYHD